MQQLSYRVSKHIKCILNLTKHNKSTYILTVSLVVESNIGNNTSKAILLIIQLVI